ncbi:hypothetical protein LTR62_000957 [Meristemomyces frigidus]|uniref:RING-type domain-containing protein n=1 Tax=Meristemomyces frigidus TaxID=1508187 RepID=A0AAN7T9S6_9PEZI|nr:hypothetical protein LTR62_000957 [Meristemomyces frigidus]
MQTPSTPGISNPFAAFDCGLCLEHFPPGVSKSFRAGESRVCPKCALDEVVPQFHAAYQHEHAWPVMFGQHELDVYQYVVFLSRDFADRYREKENEEYGVPVLSRAYCHHTVRADPTHGSNAITGIALEQYRDFDIPTTICGHYLGTKLPGWIGKCDKCNGTVCKGCGRPKHPGQGNRGFVDNEAEYYCQCNAPATAAAAASQYDGLEKGIDYQLCPQCRVPVHLAAGCNHMKCPSAACAASFCFICGELAEDDSGHWAMGMPCPRWNARGAANAHHDGEDVDGEDLEDVDGEDLEDVDGEDLEDLDGEPMELEEDLELEAADDDDEE